jgi:pimeloyl-ACP methyl ester carboxylesterase
MIGARHAHLRRAGQGRPVLLIHECPRSTACLVPLLEAVAAGPEPREAIAIDLPGFGGSDPLAAEPVRIEDLADAIHAVAQHLGIRRCPVYGAHTGAKVAIELALRHPEMVSGLVLEGVSMNPPNATMVPGEGYLAGYAPRQDGAHLAELWCRERDQYRFFPWNDRTLAKRLRFTLPSPEAMQAHLMELLVAGPEFGRTYVAPYRYDARASLPNVRVPTLIACREDDVLYGHLQNLPPLSANFEVRPLPAGDEHAREVAVRTLVAYESRPLEVGGGASEGAFDEVDAASSAVAEHRRLVRVRSGNVHVREYRGATTSTRSGSASSTPPGMASDTPPGSASGTRPGSASYAVAPGVSESAWLTLADFPGSSAASVALNRRLAARARVLAPDLPGCADSETSLGADMLTDAADAIADACRALGVARVTVYAPTLASPLAVRLAARHPELAERVVLDGWLPAMPGVAARLRAIVPGLRPATAGEHLLRAWHLLRDQQLAWPWFAHEASAVRAVVPELDAEAMHAAMVDLLKQPEGLRVWAAIAEADTRAELVALGERVTLLSVPGEPAHAAGAALAAEVGLRHVSRGPAQADLATALESLRAG